jgi:D-amino-acid dehydrogenase
MHVAVIGAGIIGACCAVELTRDGHAVTLLDAGEPGGEQAASYGNGAWISPASVVPMSMPGLWKRLPGYLLDRNGPLVMRWSALPALAPWLLRFIWAGHSVARVEKTARALAQLLGDAPQRHRALAAEAGVERLVESKGLLYAYTDRAAFAAEALAWRLRRDNGVAWRELDCVELRALVPMLAASYGLGVLVPAGAHCRDPGAYVAALVRLAVARGARLVRTRATGFDFNAGRLRAVLTTTGALACDRAVIAAGIGSRQLAPLAGDPVFLESERGYHAVLADPGFELPVPVMPADGKMGNTSTDGGLRLSGQVELASVDAPPDWRRADVLVGHACRAYPSLREGARAAIAKRWMGHRPSMPDGLPALGAASASGDVIHAFGHGHVGLASGPISGRIVADVVGGVAPGIDCAPYRPQRFA